MNIFLLDWLPRGGIAQTTETWRRIGESAGHSIVVAGRTGGHLRTDLGVVRKYETKIGALEAHVRLARIAAREIEERRPDVVYVQNYWYPLIERKVFVAAERVGTRTVLAVHNHRPHSFASGSSAGMRDLVRAADTVVAHSEFVAERVRAMGAADVRVVPLPLPMELLDAGPTKPCELPEPTDQCSRAVSFGVLARRYKHAGVLAGLVDRLPPRWELVLAGVGAPEIDDRRSVTVDRFLSPSELRWTIESASVALLPYRRASQSGAVVLAQALGVPPVTTRVGGLPGQIRDGETGILLGHDCPLQSWAEVLREIEARPDWWRSMSERCRTSTLQTHHEATLAWLNVVEHEQHRPFASAPGRTVG